MRHGILPDPYAIGAVVDLSADIFHDIAVITVIVID